MCSAKWALFILIALSRKQLRFSDCGELQRTALQQMAQRENLLTAAQVP
jgi:hypothetical protein